MYLLTLSLVMLRPLFFSVKVATTFTRLLLSTCSIYLAGFFSLTVNLRLTVESTSPLSVSTCLRVSVPERALWNRLSTCTCMVLASGCVVLSERPSTREGTFTMTGPWNMPPG